MATLTSRSKLGFFPTPDTVVDALGRALRLPQGLYALDPCCGAGSALARLCPGASTYGIELDVARAMEAKGRLDHVLAVAMQDARVANNAFGLVYLNPPYDSALGSGRLEETMLERSMRFIEPGGVLVYIIQHNRYSPEVLELLGKNFHEFAHACFDPADFEAFGQTVLLARRGDHMRRSVAEMRHLLGLRDADEKPSLPGPISSWSVTWDIPKGKSPHIFYAMDVPEEATAAMLAASPLARRPPAPIVIDAGTPLLPLKRGHLALVLASGACNGVYGEGERRHVVKGSVQRIETEEESHDTTAGGNDVLIKKRTFAFEILLRCMTADGKIHEVQGSPPASHEDGFETEGEGE